MIFIFVLLGFVLAAVGAVVMTRRDTLGRFMLVAGATIMMIGLVAQSFAVYF